MKDNVFRIFGTYSIIRMLSPSLRSGPFTGLEWSFQLKDEGYDEEGLKLRGDDIEMAERRKGKALVADSEVKF